MSTESIDRVVTCQELNLRGYRQRRGVTLEDISDRTKISPMYLRAIEEENYSDLPGGVFDVNYIRQYAEQIGFDASSLLRRYHEKKCADGSSGSVSSEHGRTEQIAPIRWLRTLAGLVH